MQGKSCVRRLCYARNDACVRGGARSSAGEGIYACGQDHRREERC